MVSACSPWNRWRFLVGIELVAQYAKLALETLPPGSRVPGQSEISRVLQGIIGGVGFLGAGAVIQSKRAVRGVTTAAAVWVVAALGTACGMGFYHLAIILGIATLFTLVVLEIVEDRYFPDPDDPWSSEKGKKNKVAESDDDPQHEEPGAGAGPVRGKT